MRQASLAAMTETPEPFLHRDGDAYTPTMKANGWWREGGNLHARVMIGLFAHVIEQQYGEPDLQPARLTADLYRLPDLSPLTVTTRVVRQGGRIKVVEAELFSGGVSVKTCCSQKFAQAVAMMSESSRLMLTWNMAKPRAAMKAAR